MFWQFWNFNEAFGKNRSPSPRRKSRINPLLCSSLFSALHILSLLPRVYRYAWNGASWSLRRFGLCCFFPTRCTNRPIDLLPIVLLFLLSCSCLMSSYFFFFNGIRVLRALQGTIRGRASPVSLGHWRSFIRKITLRSTPHSTLQSASAGACCFSNKGPPCS